MVMVSRLLFKGALLKENTDVFHIMRTMRAMRRLKPDPVPDDLIAQVLEAGTAAPNGGNSQRWRFLVVKDPAIKKRIQVWYRKGFDEIVVPRHAAHEPAAGPEREKHARELRAIEYLTDHYHEAPIWIVACLNDGPRATRSTPGSIYPAVQNMLLACRALGLGATLTARHLAYEKEVEKILELPQGYHPYAIIPIGWPMGKFGPIRRAPLEQVVYVDRWGVPWPGA
jgi:nitroreductase